MKFNYAIIMNFDLGESVQAMCAMAEAPDDYLMNILTSLKLIMACRDHKIMPGSQIRIIDMMTKSNAMFEAALKGFPHINKLARRHRAW